MDKIIVTKHKAVEQFIRESGLVPGYVKCHKSVTPNFIKDKHVYGILPLSLAAEAELFTEVKITLPKSEKNKRLSLEELKPLVKGVVTYTVKKIKEEEIL